MAKFRKKPIVIEATQWFPGVYIEGVDNLAHLPESFRDCAWIATLEGGHVVSRGDWIITGIKGEKYPCKPDIFEATYERVV